VHDRIEETRDLSHVRMLRSGEFQAIFDQVGLAACSRMVPLTKREFDE